MNGIKFKGDGKERNGAGFFRDLDLSGRLCYGQRQLQIHDRKADHMAEILKVDGANLAQTLESAVRLITSGRVVAFPTDTVYGLGADPFNLAAVSEVYRVKGRAFNRPLPLLVSSLDQAMELTSDPPRLFFELATKYWPGPLTLVVPGSRLVPLRVTGNTGNIGLRWPRSNVALALITASARPLTGTSANLANHAECKTAAEVDEQIGKNLPLILDGGSTGDNASSTVVALTGLRPQILRHGPISETELKEFFG
ncbi:MAG: threonylcarbamoyl-AMP synthase [Acidobacteriota bacterium]|nr:threonylcarbamoyl-AMP synthase [Acidobacteriota bacterium]